MNMKDGNKGVLGIGNALVDVINMLENDEVLEQFGLPRGSMTLVNAKLSGEIFETTQSNKREITTGGSAANTIHALAALGVSCGYIGKIGNDVLGAAFREEFKQKKIKTHLLTGKKDTGRVMALVSTDSERTMATYLGAAADLKPKELTDEMFRGFAFLFIEGYLVQDHALIEKAIDLARQEQLKIAIDLSSFNVVEANLSFLKKIIQEKVDIVFANEEEAFSFTGKSPEDALSEIASMCEIAVVKTGHTGSLIQRGNEKVKIAIVPANAIDTTGAGDIYAAGFLCGLIKDYNLEKCGQIAALISAKVVEVIGAKIPDALWPGILKAIENPD
jgi:sugar/nucleoside kinase (ribokinase family)